MCELLWSYLVGSDWQYRFQDRLRNVIYSKKCRVNELDVPRDSDYASKSE